MMKRRGYILVFVLGVTSVVTALGLSYIAANGTVMTQATNRYAAVRAQYVAESGAALAGHYLMYPPTTVATNSFYTGATGVAIDETADSVDIRVTSSSPTNRYVIQAGAVVRNSFGTEALAKQTVRAEVIVPTVPKWKIAQALLSSGSVNVPSGVTISGNLHSNVSVNGPLLGGSCTGAVSAVLTAVWLASGPPTSVLSLQPAISCPSATVSLYQNYKINGVSYTAYTGYAKTDMGAADSAALNSAVNVSGTNPGRIAILPTGNMRFKNDVNFTGCLVVRGDLEVDGSNITLQAVTDYPSLVITGNLLFRSNDKTLTVTGPVVCAGQIMDNGRDRIALVVNGATIVSNGLSRTGSSSTMRFVWNSTNSVFWDLAKTANPEPITVLEWQEN